MHKKRRALKYAKRFLSVLTAAAMLVTMGFSALPVGAEDTSSKDGEGYMYDIVIYGGNASGIVAAIGKDIDERYKIKTGSILIPNMTVSGQ